MSNFQPNFLFLPYEILSDDRLTLRQIRVLMAILSWRKKNTNLARISREMISDRTGYPLTRVSNITTQLEKLGWISKKGNGGKSQWCEYEIKDVEKLIAHKSNGDQNGNHDQNGNDTVTETVTSGVTNSDTGIDTGISTVKGTDIYTPGFEKWWDVYPKHKTGKNRVFRRWKKQKLEPMADDLVADVLLRINESVKWGGGIICHPNRYLEEERWTEVLDKKEIDKESYEYLGFIAQQAIEEKKSIEVA